ncbi:MAG: phage tail protein, partial [Lactobacillus crispatus]|nr:phage tail protein [Lactobacillus crispatus]MCT7713063.1 phage tail protein [Lactobacillus crispatus]
MGINDNSEIIFHNRSSTDFGIKVLFPFNPLAPAPKKQMMSIPGRSGDWATNDSTYNSSETPVNVVIHLPRRYEDWEQLKNDIENWLYGDEDWLRFSRNSDYLYRAQIVTAPTFTPVNFERTNATFTFHFQPYKYDVDSIHWQDFPRNGTVY